MALEKVVENIREEGRKAAAAKVDAARREAAEILADAEKQAASIREKRSRELALAAEQIQRRELAAAELEAKKIRLNAEKEMLAKTREAILDRLSKLPVDQRVNHLKALAQRSTIAGGRVLVAERDADAARKAGLDVAGTVKALGGVVVLSPDGATREDLTYETLVEDVWTSSLNVVAETLLGKAK